MERGVNSEVLHLWSEARNKHNKDLYSSCQELLKSAITLGDGHLLNLTLIPLLHNNRLVSQFNVRIDVKRKRGVINEQEALVAGQDKHEAHEYEEIYSSLKDVMNDSLQHKVALAIVAYNCALMRCSKGGSSALQESLLSFRIVLAMMNSTKRETKKRKLETPPMLHINPSGVANVIEDVVSDVHHLFHESSSDPQRPCGAVCVFFEVLLKTIDLYIWLNMIQKNDTTTREHCMTWLRSLVATLEGAPIYSKVRYYTLAVGSVLDRESPKAFQYLNKCLEQHKDFFPAIYLKAQLEFEKGRFEEAKRLFRACSIDQHFRTSDSLNMEGACLLKMGKTQAAMQKLQQSIALEESKISPIFNASAVYKATNQPSLEFEMLNFISKGIKLLPKEDKSTSDKIDLDAISPIDRTNNVISSETLSPLALKYLMANAAVRCADYRFATTAYNEVIAKVKNDNEELAVASLIKIISELVFILLEQKNYKKAVENCNVILKINPSNPQALIYKADALYAVGKLTRALETLDQALTTLKSHRNFIKKDDVTDVSCNPLSAEDTNRLSLLNLQIQAYNNKAVVLIQLSRDTEAIKAFQLSLQINPKWTKTCFLYTVLLMKVGKYVDACVLWMDHRAIADNLSKVDCMQLLEARKNDVKGGGGGGGRGDEQLDMLDKTIVTKYFTLLQVVVGK